MPTQGHHENDDADARRAAHDAALDRLLSSFGFEPQSDPHRETPEELIAGDLAAIDHVRRFGYVETSPLSVSACSFEGVAGELHGAWRSFEDRDTHAVRAHRDVSGVRRWARRPDACSGDGDGR